MASLNVGGAYASVRWFDEPLLEITNLNNVLLRELGRLDRSRLRVIIASRRSLWRATMTGVFASWWHDGVVTLALGPLTESDIRIAASTEVADTDAFTAALQKAGAWPLAARPVTLRMLLASWGSRAMPSRRVDAYRVGVAGLVAEDSPRRRERRHQGTPLLQRVTAARHLAALTLLTGRPHVVRRSRPGGTRSDVALDQIATVESPLDVLDDVFDSAVLTGSGEARAWAHRSIEEYLCAERLSGLPLATAASLLSDPADPGKVLPQFADTAGWLAALSTEALTWVVDQDPAILVNPDLRSRSEDEKRLIGRAVLARLAGDEIPTDLRAYDALAYEGLAEDLSPLLAPTEPTWRRREAARIIAETGMRDADEKLVQLIEVIAADQGSHDDSDEVQVAIWAIIALRVCADPALLDRLKRLAADGQNPGLLRAEIIGILWPKHISTTELLEMVGPADTPLPAAFRRRLAYILIAAVRAGTVPPAELLGWFVNYPDSVHRDNALRELAGVVIGSVIATSQPGTTAWRDAAGLVRYQLEATGDLSGWRTEDLDKVGDDRRRAVARDALLGRSDGASIDRFLQHGIISPADLEWWLTELARRLDGDPAAALSARAVIEELAWIVPEQDASIAVASALTQHESLRAVADDIFGEAATRRRAEARAPGVSGQAGRSGHSTQEDFSADRLDRALAASDFFPAFLELERPVPASTQAGGAGRRIPAWQMLDESRKQRTAAVALGYLERRDLDSADWDTISCISEALKILLEQDPAAVTSIPAEQWLKWLPGLVSAPRGYLVVGTVLKHASSADREMTEQSLITEMRHEAEIGAVILSEFVRGYRFTSLSKIALELASTDSVRPTALPGLLRIAETVFPAETAATALAHIQRRSASPVHGPGMVREENAPWECAVAAATILASSDQLPTAFGELLDAFREDNKFALDVVRAVENSGSVAWHALNAAQLADLYLWACDHLPPERPMEPGVAVRIDSAEALPAEIIRRLAQLANTEAADALETLGSVTGDVWIKHAARAARESARATKWIAPDPSAVMDVISNHERRIVVTSEQLADVVVACIDNLAVDLTKDRALRAQLWHRQRQGNAWVGYVPLIERELSDWLSRELRRRIGLHIAILREVEIQPHLSGTAADIPDLLAVSVVTGSGSAEIPIEVKCNWNRDVRTAIETQLGDRYLNGPHGTTGIYIVACYGGSAWADGDSRRDEAKPRNPDSLISDLEPSVQSLAASGITVHCRILDLRLDKDADQDGST